MAALALLFAVAGLGARPAALTGPDPAAFTTKLEEAARALAARAQGGPCPGAMVTSVEGAPVDAAGLQRDGIRSDGVIAASDERLRVTGCGRESVVKLYIARRGDGFGVIPLNPGTGMAGFRLSRDAMQGAVGALAMQKPPPPCDAAEQSRTLRLADTALTSPYGVGRPWTEHWTFSVCGEARAVDLAFTPAADGGTDWSIKAR